jgi:hypothetical protein
MTNPGKQPSVADVMTIPRQQECAADDMTLQCKRRFPGPHRGGPLRVASALRGGRTVGLVHTVCSVADGQSGWFIQFAPWRTDSRVGSYSLLVGPDGAGPLHNCPNRSNSRFDVARPPGEPLREGDAPAEPIRLPLPSRERAGVRVKPFGLPLLRCHCSVSSARIRPAIRLDEPDAFAVMSTDYP